VVQQRQQLQTVIDLVRPFADAVPMIDETASKANALAALWLFGNSLLAQLEKLCNELGGLSEPEGSVQRETVTV
jgi:hypothetical protein